MREFHLLTRWQLPAGVGEVWDELAAPEFRWPLWWPHLSAESAVVPGGTTASSCVRVRVRSPLGWSLRFVLALEFARAPEGTEPGRTRALATGDLVGTADAQVEAAGTGTAVSLDWHVALVRGGVVGLLPGPLLAAAHAAVMRAGERGLAAHLAANGNTAARPPGRPARSGQSGDAGPRSR